MSFEALQERLTALQETTSQLKELIDRLANLKFQPGSVPLGTEEESSVSGELSAEIGQLLRTGLEEQEILQEEAKYLRLEGHDKTRLSDGIQRLGAELLSFRSAFRRARLSARKSLDQAQKAERELLIHSFSVPVSEIPSPSEGNGEATDVPILHLTPRYIHQQHQQTSLSEEDQQNVGASSNVTDALRRTHDMIASELSRSEFAHQTLTESSNALKQLDESYGSLDTMLVSSREMLGTLLHSQKSDTWYLQTAFYMLLVTGAWLIFRRLLYGPTWWLVWLPLRILFGVGSKAGGALMSERTAAGESGKVPVHDQGVKVPVEGLPNSDLPTAQVGQKTQVAGDPDSMVEQVAKLLDEANKAAEEGASKEDGENDEHDGTEQTEGEKVQVAQEAAGDGRARDEL